MMAEIKKVNNLEITQDLPFQKRSWTVQRFGWVLMVLLLLATLLGLFGSGPLSQTSMRSENASFSLAYERFGRISVPNKLRVQSKTEADGVLRVWFDRAYLEQVQIEKIVPEPHQVELASDRLIYNFLLAQGHQGGEVSFYVTPLRWGILTGQVGLEEGEMVRFSQVIYP